MPFFRANFSFEVIKFAEKNEQSISVTVVGTPDISALSECEKNVLFCTLFRRISELARGGEQE